MKLQLDPKNLNYAEFIRKKSQIGGDGTLFDALEAQP